MSSVSAVLQLRALDVRSHPRAAGLTLLGVGSAVVIARRVGYWPSDLPSLPTAESDREMLRRLQRKWKKRHAYPSRADRERLDHLYAMQMRQRGLEPRVTFDEFLSRTGSA